MKRIRILMSGFLFLILFSGIGGHCCMSMAQEPASMPVTLPVNLEPADTLSPVVKGHSPKKASVYSAVLPGLGQIYNRKYWKVPIVYAGFGTLAYFVVYNGSRLKKYTQAYLDFTDTLAVTDSYLDLIGPNLDPATFDPVLYPDSYNPSLAESFENLLKNNRDYFRRYRDLSYIGLAAWYVLNIIDASVDAHMYDFDVGEDLVLRVEPAWQPTGYGMNMTGVRCTLTF
ncbi:MAG TPA: hypothetical protein ENN63_12430 [Bacteroidetes bacterium]|nr:hypothetical protein [Bacteroidota bacterium]